MKISVFLQFRSNSDRHTFQKILRKRRTKFARKNREKLFRHFFAFFFRKKIILEYLETHSNLVASKIGAKNMLPQNVQYKFCARGTPPPVLGHFWIGFPFEKIGFTHLLGQKKEFGHFWRGVGVFHVALFLSGPKWIFNFCTYRVSLET